MMLLMTFVPDAHRCIAVVTFFCILDRSAIYPTTQRVKIQDTPVSQSSGLKCFECFGEACRTGECEAPVCMKMIEEIEGTTSARYYCSQQKGIGFQSNCTKPVGDGVTSVKKFTCKCEDAYCNGAVSMQVPPAWFLVTWVYAVAVFFIVSVFGSNAVA